MYPVGIEDPPGITYSVAHVKEVPRAEKDLGEPSQAGCVGSCYNLISNISGKQMKIQNRFYRAEFFCWLRL